MEFSELNLNPDLMRGLEEAGYHTCMPVQEAVFSPAFAGKDIYAQSQTGTGKTAAFLISIFQRLLTATSLRHRKVLILAPTRELAVQIEGEVERLGKYLPISSAAFYGGVGYGPQIDALRADVQMMIGTPGRIIDLVKQGKMLLKDVGFLVIDEADRMFDMGFIDDLRKLLRYLPAPGERQTFLFSATLGLRVKDLAWEYMADPTEIVIEPEKVTVELVTQELYHVGSHEKMRLLLGLLEREKPESAIIFCNQKAMVEELARRLRVNGIDCEYIMGDLPQSKRLEIIERLKAGKLSLLVATDVAARGLDIEGLDLVVNYDLPDDTESYVHRIGRTARAGKTGKAVTLACEKFVFNLPAIEKFIGMKIPVAPFDSSLMLVDKSEGIRFHRSSEGRGKAGNRTHGGGRRYEDRSHGTKRYEARRGDHRRADTVQEGTREGPARSGQRPGRGNPRQPTSSRTADVDMTNPYALSQDERLKMYKARYGEGGKTQSAGQDRKSSPRSGGDERKPRGPAPNKRPPVTGKASSPKADRSPAPPKDRAGSARPGSPAQRPAPAMEQGKNPKEAKPGLLTTLKRLFSRRGDR